MNFLKIVYNKNKEKKGSSVHDQTQKLKNENEPKSPIPSPEKIQEKEPIKQKENESFEEERPTELVPWRTFSIFISSTFADMQAKRDYLKHIVFLFATLFLHECFAIREME